MIKLTPAKKNVTKRTRQSLSALGINYTDDYRDGELASCSGISTRRYPYIATTGKIDQITSTYFYGNSDVWTGLQIKDMYAMDDQPLVLTYSPYTYKVQAWLLVDNGWYDITQGATVTLSNSFPKQYAVVNTKLCIFPDGVYIDLESTTTVIQPMGKTMYWSEANGSVVFENKSESTCRVTFPGSQTIDFRSISALAIGERVNMQGCLSSADDNVTLTITNRWKTWLEFSYQWTVEGSTSPLASEDNYRRVIITENDTSTTNVLPSLDFIASQDNRLYGCSNLDKTIYVSALGDPCDFGTYEGVATDAYAVVVGSMGDFTGCIATGNSVLFLKQHCIHKLLGSYPADFYLKEYALEGVLEGCSGSLVCCEGIAVYISEHGIAMYNGSSVNVLNYGVDPSKVSGQTTALFDGREYWLSCLYNNQAALFEFNLDKGILVQAGSAHAKAMVHAGTENYYVADDKLYHMTDAANTNATWEMVFKPFIETVSSSKNSTSEVFEKKRYTRLFLRTELPQGSTITAAWKKPDANAWTTIGTITGAKNEVNTLVYQTPRTDTYQLKLSGTGPMTILSMQREFQQKESSR